jgi:biotin carboxyl carrier protein
MESGTNMGIHVVLAQNPTDSPEEHLVIQEIFVKLGQEVAIGTLLFIAEGAKVVFDVESSTSGIIQEILIKPNDKVQIGQPLITIQENQ